MGKIGIYGGSFNPPHVGHTLAARELAAALNLNKVVFIPAALPPHKPLPAGSPDAATRLALLREAVKSVPSGYVSDLELRREGPSYSVDTLEELARQYPDDKLYLLMGTDMFLSLHQWREPARICQCAVIATAHREPENGLLHEKILKQADRLRKNYGAEVMVADNRFVEISSTMLRRMLRFQCAEPFLEPGVWNLIKQLGCYGVNEDLRDLPFETLKTVSLSLHMEKRVPHVIGCCETAVSLARLWGANVTDAARAGILHDVTKALDKRAQLLLCEKYGIMVGDFERENYKLLHSKTAAAVAKHIFGENDAVCEAIYWHTTGRADMKLLEKILYIADYMEPNRSFDGVETLRALTQTDLDEALLRGFQMSLDLLISEGKEPGIDSLQARDFLLKERNKA